MRADQALERFVAELGLENPVLDIGSGDGAHAQIMRDRGLGVLTLDTQPPADVVCDYLKRPFYDDYAMFDAIWCSHVLEHQRNVGAFLDKIYSDLSVGGLLGITVPPYREKLAGGHVNQFTPAMLVYHLILAGFDCSQARVGIYGYNISVLVNKQPLPKGALEGLIMDNGDIERLDPYFPWPVRQGIQGGELGSVRW